MALAFAHKGTLYLVLDEENIERMQRADPFDFNVGNAPPMALRMPPDIVVAYASTGEQEAIAALPDGVATRAPQRISRASCRTRR